MLAALLTTPGCKQNIEKEVSLIFAGDTHGWITPCGCAANQSGGLARRATLVQKSKLGGDVLLLDIGGSAIGTTTYQRTRFSYLLTGLHEMGLTAHNIGAAETAFSPHELSELGKATQTSWLSSNLRDAEGHPPGKKTLSLENRGLKIDIASVIDPLLVEHPSWQASEPIQAILKAFQNSDADVRIVLAYFDEAGLRRLAESLPDVDYIVGGPTGQSLQPTRVHRTTILSATNKGKFLAHLRLRKGKKSFEEVAASIEEVSSHYEEDKRQMANLQSYYRELAQKDFISTESGITESVASVESDYAIAGSAACTGCHAKDDAVWHNSKHSNAWSALVAKDAQYDPHCQNCHTTGYAQSGGFVNVAQSESLVGVGCENCHGPSQAHVRNPKKRTPFLAKQQCVQCHDHENSPHFQPDAYWAKVFHAGSKKP